MAIELPQTSPLVKSCPNHCPCNTPARHDRAQYLHSLAAASYLLSTDGPPPELHKNAFSYTCYTPPDKGSAAPGRSPYNPGAGHDARVLAGGLRLVTEGYRRWHWLPPTLGPKTGGRPVN